MTTIHVLLIGNDTILEVERLRDEVSGDFSNDAVVTVTLVDTLGAEVAGESWPKLLTYVADSDGLYRATLPYTLVLVPNGRYTAQLMADAGDLRATWTLDCVARVRN